MVRKSIVVIAIAVLCSCGNTEKSIRIRQLEPVDTLGAETAEDGVVFGSIASAAIMEDGRMVVLDGIGCTIRIFDTAGNLLSTAAGRGSGPGELMAPLDMVLLSTGNIAVSDWEAWGVLLYDPELVYSGFIGPMPGGAPMAMAAGSEGNIIGLGLSFFNENGDASGEYFLASWADSVEPSSKYFQGRASVIPSEGGEIEIRFPDVVFDTSPAGEIYAALSTDSTYEVIRYSSQGDESAFIRRSVERMDLPAAMALLQETEGSENPETGALQIAGIYCQGDSLVWVRRGDRPYPFFEVFDHDGNLTCKVECPDIPDPYLQMDFLVEDDAILAWDTNPPDYPRVYRMELR